MPTLKQLLLDDNELTGALPLTWGAAGAMPSLQVSSLRFRVWATGFSGSQTGHRSGLDVCVISENYNDTAVT